MTARHWTPPGVCGGFTPPRAHVCRSESSLLSQQQLLFTVGCCVLQAGDAAMVLSLSGLEEVEDRNLLAGSLMVLLEQDINQAQVHTQMPAS